MQGPLEPGRRPTVTAQIVVRAPSDATSLPDIRDAVRRHLTAARARPHVIADLELAVSELATNVVHHSTSPDIVVGLEQSGTSWVLDVHGAASLDAVVPHVPEADSTDGRGLIVAVAVTDHVELVDVDGERIVRCWRAA